mmetsp:Transcript_90598/g.184629  ORF Transcript_90598/g.184629 Transcript_90598/m.184629 type:complete len:88 (-) Transcript_90598:1842-2105(-)
MTAYESQEVTKGVCSFYLGRLRGDPYSAQILPKRTTVAIVLFALNHYVDSGGVISSHNIINAVVAFRDNFHGHQNFAGFGKYQLYKS